MLTKLATMRYHAAGRMKKSGLERPNQIKQTGGRFYNASAYIA